MHDSRTPVPHAPVASVQLHQGAITVVAAHAGFCATGSADRLLRLLSCDCRETCIEAAHESPVTGGGACEQQQQARAKGTTAWSPS